jgi:hypothetical protein
MYNIEKLQLNKQIMPMVGADYGIEQNSLANRSALSSFN